MENELCWKMTFEAIQPLMENTQRTTNGGRQPLMEEDFEFKTAFDGR